MLRPRGRVHAVRLLALAAVYLGAGKLGLSLALVHASASAVWPPTGIALAAFLLLGRSVWPAIFMGAFLVNVTTEGNVATSLGIALGNTLEGLVGAELVRRFAGGAAAFDRPRNVFKYVVLAGLVATAISPSFGVTSLCLGGFADWSNYASVWLTWWLGDVGGAVVVAPALVLWAQRPGPTWTQAQRFELVGLGAATFAIGWLAFGGALTAIEGDSPLRFLCLPLTIWAAFRFGQRETAAAVLILSGIAVWGTVIETGHVPNRENASLALLQLFLGVISVTSLSLAAVVSERRRALASLALQAAELARSNAELDEFARVVSHDLKAPLRGISSLATWIVEDCKDVLSAESQEHLSLLDERARRMSRLIDGVLSYSRVGRTRGSLERVDTRAVVEEVVDSLAPRRAVTVRLAGPLPLVRFDRTQLTQVFLNLIQNAVQHIGKPSGEVVVSCHETADAFEFSVRDDGVGIPEAHRPYVFQMFHVVDPKTARAQDRRVARRLRLRGGRVGPGRELPLLDSKADALARARPSAVDGLLRRFDRLHRIVDLAQRALALALEAVDDLRIRDAGHRRLDERGRLLQRVQRIVESLIGGAGDTETDPEPEHHDQQTGDGDPSQAESREIGPHDDLPPAGPAAPCQRSVVS
jgi:signal transduction histidine kinase